jgi:hypothetical protein
VQAIGQERPRSTASPYPTFASKKGRV